MRFSIKLKVGHDLYYVGVLKPQYRFSTTYEHEIRVFGRGGECVVDEFVLAYLNYFNSFTSIIQVSPFEPFDFSMKNVFYIRLIPYFFVVIHIFTEVICNCV